MNDSFPSLSQDFSQNDWGVQSPEELKKPFSSFPESIERDLQKEWVLEVGPGNGAFITWMAAHQRDRLFFALELRCGRFEKVKEKIQKQALQNLQVFHGDARYCLADLFPSESLSEIFVLFPDPWPKRRHNKHRLLNEERLAVFHSLLKPNGKLWVATDHSDYASQIHTVFQESHWKFEEGRSLYPTYFETKWKKMGLKIHYFCFVKKVR